MYSLLCPNLVLQTLHDVNTHKLRNEGIRGIIFDLDNTIIPWDSEEMEPAIDALLRRLLADGFKLCLLSNNMVGRVGDIAKKFDIPFVSRAYKPSKGGFRRASELMKLRHNEVAVVGDQLFTDILGGNRLGMFTIWVKPLTSREFIGTKITRQLERLTVKLLKAKGLLK